MVKIMRFPITTLMIMLGGFAFAQAPFTLEQALELAVQRNYTLKNQALEVSLADKELEKIRSGRQPVIAGNGDLRYNPILQTVIIPGEAFGQPGDAPEKVRFGTRFNLLLGVDAGWKAVDPTFKSTEAAKMIEGRIEALQLAQNTLDVRLEAAEAYYDVAFQMAQVQLAEARRTRAGELDKIIRTRLASGAALAVDLQKSTLEVQHAETVWQQSLHQLQRSRLLLGHLTGKDADQLMLPENVLLSDTASLDILGDAAVGIENRAELAEAQLRLEWHQLQVTLEDKRYLPPLEVYANMSAQHLSDDLSVWNRWFPFAFVGVRTSIPLYDGQLRARQKEILLFKEQIARNEATSLKESLDFEWRSAELERAHALLAMRDAGRTLGLAQEVLQVEQVRLSEGALLPADFREAEFSLREAENACLAAIRQYAVAQLRRARAGGQMP